MQKFLVVFRSGRDLFSDEDLEQVLEGLKNNKTSGADMVNGSVNGNFKW